MNHPTPTLERVLQAVRDLSLVYGDRRYIHVEMAQTTIDDIAESVLGPGQRFGDLPVQLIGIPVIVNDTIPQGAVRAHYLDREPDWLIAPPTTQENP